MDTLNAYCGLWFVHCPCLAQGRFVIHPAELLALGISLSLSREGGLKFDCASLRTEC